MTRNTRLADQMHSAIEDAERLVPWARDNDIIVQVGGHLSIISQPGRGTIVEARIRSREKSLEVA